MLTEKSLILGRNEKDMMKSITVFVQSTCYSCQILIKFEFSGQTFENIHIKFHGNLSSGSRVPCGQADGRIDTQT
jgi:hypothetical protein